MQALGRGVLRQVHKLTLCFPHLDLGSFLLQGGRAVSKTNLGELGLLKKDSLFEMFLGKSLRHGQAIAPD